MHAVVVANGELPGQGHDHLRSLLTAADLVVAADGGLRHCVELGVWPHTLVGDLDSAPEDLVGQTRHQQVEVLQWPADKEATDLELAMELAAVSGATDMTVVAAFGARLDHELATIGLLASHTWASIAVTATDGRRMLSVVRDTAAFRLSVGATVTLLPWGGDVDGVTTAGLKWPLRNELVELGSTRGVSNIASAPTQTVSVAGGVLLVIADPG